MRRLTAVDSDVLAIYHIFTRDTRFSITNDFMEATRTIQIGFAIFNVLEVYGIACAAGRQERARELYELCVEGADVQVLYPPVNLASLDEFWTVQNLTLRQIMERGVRLGEAVIIWCIESTDCDSLVTWNKRHFEGKTSVRVMTPEEWLAAHVSHP